MIQKDHVMCVLHMVVSDGTSMKWEERRRWEKIIKQEHNISNKTEELAGKAPRKIINV